MLLFLLRTGKRATIMYAIWAHWEFSAIFRHILQAAAPHGNAGGHARRKTQMILAIDVGNSNIVMGGYQDSVVSFVSRMQTDRAKEADQYAIQLKAILALYGVHREGIDGIVISCVVPSANRSTAEPWTPMM